MLATYYTAPYGQNAERNVSDKATSYTQVRQRIREMHHGSFAK